QRGRLLPGDQGIAHPGPHRGRSALAEGATDPAPLDRRQVPVDPVTGREGRAGFRQRRRLGQPRPGVRALGPPYPPRPGPDHLAPPTPAPPPPAPPPGGPPPHGRGGRGRGRPGRAPPSPPPTGGDAGVGVEPRPMPMSARGPRRGGPPRSGGGGAPPCWARSS